MGAHSLTADAPHRPGMLPTVRAPCFVSYLSPDFIFNRIHRISRGIYGFNKCIIGILSLFLVRTLVSFNVHVTRLIEYNAETSLLEYDLQTVADRGRRTSSDDTA